MRTPAYATGTGGAMTLALALAAGTGCGLDTAGLRQEDAAPSDDAILETADGIVGADADVDGEPDADQDGRLEIPDGPGDGARDDARTCIPGQTRPCVLLPGVCGPVVQTCLASGEWGGCVDTGPPPTPEVCDGLDSDCDGLTDDLGRTTCGVGACEVTVENCVGGVPQTCVPGAPTTCDAAPAYCHQTTTGTDDCGGVCSKVGPPACYTVHPACLDSSPGSYTDSPSCDTPRGRYDCGLSCQPFPNVIGADCIYCVNTHCADRSGLDEAQFHCNNIPVPPTP